MSTSPNPGRDQIPLRQRVAEAAADWWDRRNHPMLDLICILGVLLMLLAVMLWLIAIWMPSGEIANRLGATGGVIFGAGFITSMGTLIARACLL